MSQKTNKIFKVFISCDYTNRIVDVKHIQASSKAMAKQKAIASVEAHLDWHGDETCPSGFYPNYYSVDVRELTTAEITAMNKDADNLRANLSTVTVYG